MEILSRSEFRKLKEESRRKYEETLLNFFRVGSFVTVPDATGGANTRIYRIVKLWKAEERDKVERRGWGNNQTTRPVKNKCAEAQVECVFNPVFGKKRPIGKTTYDLYRLRPVDIAELGAMFQSLKDIIDVTFKEASEDS